MIDHAYLEAYVAISQVKARYCRTLDTKDWQGYGDVFTDDVELDTRPAGGYLTHGREELLRMVRGSIGDAATAHQVHSPEIVLEDANTARVIWAMQDRVVWDAERAAKMGNLGHTGYGHYHETYTRHEGRWRIAAQKLTRLHTDVHYA